MLTDKSVKAGTFINESFRGFSPEAAAIGVGTDGRFAPISRKIAAQAPCFVQIYSVCGEDTAQM